MTRLFNQTEAKEKRRSLRKNMPTAEIILWSRLRGKNLNGLKFRRQYSIGSFVVDFYCPELRLAVEIDGESHYTEGAQERDKLRQTNIESAGVTILRFTNGDVYERLEGVIDRILDKARQTHLP